MIYRLFIFATYFLFWANPNLAQSIDSLFVEVDQTPIEDSTERERYVPTLDEFLTKGKQFTIQTNQIRLELIGFLDTAEFASEIPEMSETLTALQTRLESPNSRFNLRYINALELILENIQIQSDEFGASLNGQLRRLRTLDSLVHTMKDDKIFQFRMRDTLLLPGFGDEFLELKAKIAHVDSLILTNELISAKYQSQLNSIGTTLLELNQLTKNNRKEMERGLLSKEINYIWESNLISTPKSIFQITQESLQLNLLLLYRHLRANILALLFSLALFFGFHYLITLQVREIREKKDYGQLILERVRFFTHSPISATVISILPVTYFIFSGVSVTFLTFLIVTQICFTALLIRKNYPNRIFLKWLLLLIIILFFSIINLYWEIAYQERFYLLIGGLITIYLVWDGLKNFQTDESGEERFLKWLSLAIIPLIGLGLIANILGRFSLSKILIISGSIGYMHAISLYFFVNVLMEAIYLVIENSKKESDSFTSLIDFKGIQDRLKGFMLLLAVMIWASVLLQNLALDDLFLEKAGQFLDKERTLGDTTFTFGSILLFAGMIYIASILANNIAYFASIQDQKNAGTRKKRLGSSILIIRLVILTMGFFLALTAAKIPLDKITIVLGALSVGIGFGLQTIINNLVSGIILAFERPIQIGDEIQVGTMSGSVKEVGIRASKIQGYDGSEIIVPNGDLLSQSLINWTLSDKRRRIELLIGVAYDSDMDLVKRLLQEVLDRERVMRLPAPRVFMQNFGESSVDFRVLFWVESMDIHLEMRSEVMTAIFEKFRENHIEIPFPQRDLHFKNSIPPKNENLTTPAKNEKSPEEKSSGDKN